MTDILKTYQSSSIEELSNYITKIYDLHGKVSDPKSTAFYEITNGPYKDHSINAPNVCIKIPTGGGKTLVACESIKTIHNEYFNRVDDTGLVLWLVPTEAILEQTIKKLNNIDDIYYNTLNDSFENIKVFDIGEALSFKRHDVKNNLCIIVSTFAMFRTEDNPEKMNKMNVFKENGSLMDHFENDTTVEPSLHNAIQQYNPIVILDEAHHTKTKFSYEMIQGFNPSFVVEFTATPRNEPNKESNVLVDVNAIELKKEGMVKLPIIHTNEPDWEKVIDLGIDKRNFLEKECTILKKSTGEYIRPIMLIQAERDAESSNMIDANQVKEYLIRKRIPEDQIAIKTGTKDDLKDKDARSQTSPIRYIITVKALAEGWDNPFAYVLVSIMNTKSKIAGEQVIGRILRMPSQKRKYNEDLNRAYVFTSSPDMQQVVEDLQKELKRNGYDENDLVSLKEKKDITPTEQIIVDNDIKLPCITNNVPKGHVLEYTNLLSNSLSKENVSIGQLTSASGIHVMDTTDTGNIKTTRQAQLPSSDPNYYTKDKLLTKLKREIKRTEYSAETIFNYITNIIDQDIKNSDKTDTERVEELSKDIRTVIKTINDSIDIQEQKIAKNKFDSLLSSKKLSCVYRSLLNDMPLIDPQDSHFKKHLFNNLERMNKEESEFITQIDNIDNVKWWYRNPVRHDNAFYVSGWKPNLIYPDFIVKTNLGHYFIIEYKGEHLEGSEDTQYKQEMLKILSDLAGPKYTAKMIFKKDITNIINEIKSA